MEIPVHNQPLSHRCEAANTPPEPVLPLSELITFSQLLSKHLLYTDPPT